MKKSLKKFLRFLTVLIVLSAVYMILRHFSSESGEERENAPAVSEESVLLLPREQIQRVRILAGKKSLDFFRNKDSWQIKDYTYPLSTLTVNALIGNLTNLRAKVLLQAQKDLSVYGLDLPQKTVEIFMANGEKNLLFFGNKTPLETDFYMQVQGNPQIFLIPAVKWDLFSVNPEQYWDTSLPKIDWQNIIRFSLYSSRKPAIELRFREKSPLFMHYEFIRPASYQGFFVNSNAFYGLWQEWIQNPPQKQHIKIHAENEKSYGLHPPRLSLTLSDKNAVQLQLHIGNPDSEGNYYARLPETNEVFTLSKDYVQSLLDLTPFDLLNKFTALIPKNDVSSFLFKTPKESFWGEIIDIRRWKGINFFTWVRSLRHNRIVHSKSPDQQDEFQYYLNGNPVQDKDFLSAYQRMISLVYETEAILQPQTSDSRIMYRLIYSLKDQTNTTIDFLSYNTQYCLVRINGRNTPFLAGLYQLEKLTEVFRRL